MPEYLKQSPMYSDQVTAEVRRTVSEMLLRIERCGEPAIRRYSRELDGWDPSSFLVDAVAVDAAAAGLGVELCDHIALAQSHVRVFAAAQRSTLTDLEVKLQPGITLGHRQIPVGAVGAYVPGGRYPMLASSFMTVVVPKVAGVERVVACAPPQRGGGIAPAMLYAIVTSGADQILCLGGVQALAAMAFGIEDLRGVDMIVGAGNAYVAEAKRQLFGKVGIDLLAGPTEIVVIADEHADAELVAADLLGQAEHGPTSPAVLITTARDLGVAVLDEVGRLLETWPTRAVAQAAWDAHGSVIVVEGRDEAIAVADEIAPEHLEVQVAESEQNYYLDELCNYGSLFLGEQATVAYGDKGVGTNHVLPTMGAARYTGGLWVGKFLKTCTYQRLTEEGTRRIAPTIAAICEAEHFGGHALTATMRLERVGQAARDQGAGGGRDRAAREWRGRRSGLGAHPAHTVHLQPIGREALKSAPGSHPVSAPAGLTRAQAPKLLAGKRIAVTGASRGIGAAIAVACAQAGAMSLTLIARQRAAVAVHAACTPLVDRLSAISDRHRCPMIRCLYGETTPGATSNPDRGHHHWADPGRRGLAARG